MMVKSSTMLIVAEAPTFVNTNSPTFTTLSTLDSFYLNPYAVLSKRDL